MTKARSFRSLAGGGASSILAATLVAGVAMYLATLYVYRELGSAPYVLFAAYWSLLYLVVGSLSGVQQEMTRATRRNDPQSSPKVSNAKWFAIGLSLLVAIVIVASSFLWASPLLGDEGEQLVWPFALGAASYVIVASLAGSLFGLSKWSSIALMSAFDGLLRLGLLTIALAFTNDIVILAWCVSLAFPLAIAVIWPFARKGFINTSHLDVSIKRLSLNISQTLAASTSAALIINGFPLLVVNVSQGQDPSFVGDLILTITIIRAPLIVIALSMQSYLVVKFRDRTSSTLGPVLKIISVITILTALVSILGYRAGPDFLTLLTGRPLLIDGNLFSLVLISSGLVAAMVASGANLLAKGNHIFYSGGWLFAATVSVVAISLPIAFEERVLASLILGPIGGLLVFIVSGALLSKRSSRKADST
jgi:O-antigen/teichoic acid export membrane protein